MSALVIVLLVMLLLSLVGGVIILVFFRRRSAARPAQPSPAVPADATAGTTAEATVEARAFRWRYVVLPLAVFVLSVVSVGYFYRLLPAEVAYRFRSDGAPDGWLSRSAIVLWALVPQVFLTMLAGAVTWGIGKLRAAVSEAVTGMATLDRLLLATGNMVVIPQTILFFAMLDAFSYNSYQIHILPLRVVAVIVAVVGAIALVAFFFRTVRRSWRAPQ